MIKIIYVTVTQSPVTQVLDQSVKKQFVEKQYVITSRYSDNDLNF